MIFKSEDRVKINIPNENRSCGYNPCPDGTVATVIGYTEITFGRNGLSPDVCSKAGIYSNDSWIRLRMPDGSEHTESAYRLTLIDVSPEELDARKRYLPYAEKFLRDLPETPFYEGDRVRCFPKGWKNWETGTVSYINFLLDGYTEYGIQLESGGMIITYKNVSCPIELLSRGNYWKLEHGEPLEFANIKEEIKFWKSRGQAQQLKNPRDNLYHFTLRDAIEMLDAGNGDHIDCGLISDISHVQPDNLVDEPTTCISVWKFFDPDLGTRIRKDTQKEFHMEKLNEMLARPTRRVYREVF